MALLVFPSNPVNGQIYPTDPLVGQCQYQWSSAEQTWRLLGVATGVTPGTYCPSTTSTPRITVDAVGRVTYVECVELEFVRLNNSTAYNNYVWPDFDGNPGDVLVTDGTGTLTWIPQSGGGGAGSVIFVGAGIGLSTTSGLPITTTGTINLDPATYTSLGGVIPDGTTITIDAAGVISAAASPVGFDLAIDGGFTKLSIPTVSPPPTVGTGQYEAMAGSLYWDNVLGELFIYYDDGTTAQWVSTTGSAANLPPGLGISTSSGYTKVSIPTQSPGPAAGIGQGQAEPGSLYWDSVLGELFIYYDDGSGAQWVSTTGSGSTTLPPAGFGLILESAAYKVSIPSLNFTPTPSVAPTDATDGSLYFDTLLGAMFYRYNDGVTSQWVQI